MIVTVDEQFSVAEEFAVTGDRISVVGSNSEVRRLESAEVRTIDLQGKTVQPRQIDTHTHPLGAARYEFDHAVPTIDTIPPQALKPRPLTCRRGRGSGRSTCWMGWTC